MMDKKLIKALEPIEERFEVELFTFDEALDFYESDIVSYKSYIDSLIKSIHRGREDKELSANESSFIDGLKESIKVVDLIFGGRVEEGF